MTMRGSWLGLVGLVLTGLWPAIASATPPNCGRLVLDDPLSGGTVGDQQGGTIDGAGFVPGEPPGSIVWALPSGLAQGCVEVTVQGVTTTGVGEHDLIELFTGPDGSFTDGAADHFLLLKIAGDVFPDYEGRLKVELGLEYDALEVGSWADPVAWDPGTSYTLAVRLDGGGVAEFYRDDVLLSSVDYTEIAGGDLSFVSLRIPNDGEYQVQAALGGVVYRDVRVYDAAPPPAGDSTGGTGEGTAGGDATTGALDDTGPSATAGEGSTGGATGTGAGTGPGASDGGVASGLPLPPGQRPGDTGCACTVRGRSPWAAALWLPCIVLGWRRRRAGPVRRSKHRARSF